MSWTKTRSEIANAKRRDPDADTTQLVQKLQVERLADHIEKVAKTTSVLTAEQRDTILAAFAGLTAGTSND